MTLELLKIEKRLNQARSKIGGGKYKKVGLCPWSREFMASGSEIEHEAFLALFLSWFVFPGTWRVINPRSIPTAIHLAQGKRMAPAPAILANV